MKKHLLFFILLGLAAFAQPIEAQETDVARLQAEIQKLNDSIQSLRKSAQDRVGSTIKLIAEERIKNESFKNENRPMIDSLKKENSELKSYKAQVEPLVTKQLQEMAASDYKKWMDKTFADINAEEFSKEFDLYTKFKDKDRVASAYSNLKQLHDDFSTYQQGMKAIDSPYEATNVNALVDDIGELSKRERHSGRKKEVGRLLEQLSDYKNKVIYCQEVIKYVDALLDLYLQDGTSNKAWKQIRSSLEDKDGGKVKTYMDKIPWLGKQYDAYLKQLEQNPYGKNTARETIMNLVP